MAYSRKVIFNCHKSISEVKKNKVLKVIKPEKYLFRLKPWIHKNNLSPRMWKHAIRKNQSTQNAIILLPAIFV